MNRLLSGAGLLVVLMTAVACGVGGGGGGASSAKTHLEESDFAANASLAASPSQIVVLHAENPIKPNSYYNSAADTGRDLGLEFKQGSDRIPYNMPAGTYTLTIDTARLRGGLAPTVQLYSSTGSAMLSTALNSASNPTAVVTLSAGTYTMLVTYAYSGVRKPWESYGNKSENPAQYKLFIIPGANNSLQLTGDCRGVNLSGANFFASNLTGVDFSGSTLIGANFQNANLSGAVFAGAILRNASFNGSNLEAASFIGADLRNAFFRDTTITSANFSQTKRYDAGTENSTDFSGAEGIPRSW